MRNGKKTIAVSKTIRFILLGMWLGTVFSLGIFSLYVYSAMGDMYIWIYWLLLFAVLLAFAMLGYVTYSMRKQLMKVSVEQRGYQSSLWGQKKCFIDKSEKIYYIVFKDFNEKTKQYDKYIIFSNDSIEYKPQTSTRASMRGTFDMSTQIVLPYDDTTKKYLELEKWEKISCDDSSLGRIAKITVE